MYKKAIYLEIFLQTYDKWREGIYSSHRGLLKIKEMNTKHLENAIKDMELKLIQRQKIINNLDANSEIVQEIKEAVS